MSDDSLRNLSACQSLQSVETITMVQLDELVWDARDPVESATHPIDNALNKYVDFEKTEYPILVFVDPLRSLLLVQEPVTVQEFLLLLQNTVSTEDDCTLWLGMQKVVDCEENRSSWVSNCNDPNMPLPDCVVLFEE